MRPVAAPAPHAAHDSKVVRGESLALALAVALASAACGGGLPRPPLAAVRADDYVAVPQAPQQPIIEVVPARPKGVAHPWWIDGGWEWAGSRYRWRSGGWIDASALPRGARYAPWAVTRRKEDGQLFFAPSSFREARGAPLRAPPFVAAAEVSPGEAAPDERSGRGTGRALTPSVGPPAGAPQAAEHGSPSKSR